MREKSTVKVYDDEQELSDKNFEEGAKQTLTLFDVLFGDRKGISETSEEVALV